MKIEDNVREIKGIGDKKALALEKIKVSTVEDLIYLFPRDYQDRTHFSLIKDLESGKPALIKGRIVSIKQNSFKRGRKQLLKVLIEDGSGKLEIVFFNAMYLLNTLTIGIQYEFYGKPETTSSGLQMTHPEFSLPGKNNMQGIIPVYPLTAGISQNEMRKWHKSLRIEIKQIKEFLPTDIVKKENLCNIEYALDNIHFPENLQKLREARYRLIHDELFVLQAGIFLARNKNFIDKAGYAFSKEISVLPYINSLKYALTAAQEKVSQEILDDMCSGKSMNRLVQGDVGSGKTVVAEIALYKAVKSGYQGVLMAPTEILAKQHYEGISESFKKHGITVGLLTGSMKAAEKIDVLEKLKNGRTDVLIGTHAVIQPDVEFVKLGLVITDEQHRFGVAQRAALSRKGQNPHVLVMTATPIPRTLAVIVFGDLDISVIDQLPPGRQKIITKAANEKGRASCYDFAEKEMAKNRQVYVVAPLIEESEALNVRSAEEIYKEVTKRFPHRKATLLHGNMKQSEKDQIMENFYCGNSDILVSTVVIEVGINVPNATIIIIENSERFGLAQLHQLRGRVGRGKEQSYCFLINNSDSDVARERTKVMTESQDGFYIAEQDLLLRGPGEMFGNRQHGLPDLYLADLVKHIKILDKVKSEALAVTEKDSTLSLKENRLLKAKIHKLFGEDMDLKI